MVALGNNGETITLDDRHLKAPMNGNQSVKITYTCNFLLTGINETNKATLIFNKSRKPVTILVKRFFPCCVSTSVLRLFGGLSQITEVEATVAF